MRVYLIGSLRNPEVPNVATLLRAQDWEVFDDWYAAGPEADDYWQKYEEARGRTYEQALRGYAAQHVFNFDKLHLTRSDVVVLLMPAGKSGHLEFGWSTGKTGARGVICMPHQPERWDVMYAFADRVCVGVPALIRYLQKLERRDDE